MLFCCVEVSTTDFLPKFANWLEKHENFDPSTGEISSHISLLTGNTLFHMDSIHETSIKSSIESFYDRKSYKKVSASSNLETIISSINPHFAEQFSAFQVNNIVTTFFQNPSFPKLAIFISTSFGEELLIEPGISQIDSPQNLQSLREQLIKKVRRFWKKGAIFHNCRTLVEVVVGKPGANRLSEHRRVQRKSRKKQKFQPEIGSKPFIGQKDVVQRVKQGLENLFSGIRSGDGPLVFLFGGIAGTGKTFLGQLIAEEFACTLKQMCDLNLDELERESLFLHVDMGNYQDERAIDGFVDPSPGLEGEGLLASHFQKIVDGRTVVMLDEIEKAHESLLKDMLLPVLDSNNGHIQQKKTGNKFPTKDSIFILTTNCFDDEIEGMFSQGKSYEDIVEKVTQLFIDRESLCLSANAKGNPFSWKPLWRRITSGQSSALSAFNSEEGFFAFLPPTEEDIVNIIGICLERLHSRCVKGQLGMMREFYYSAKVIDYLLKKIGRKGSSMAVVETKAESILMKAILSRKELRDKAQEYFGYMYVQQSKELVFITEPINSSSSVANDLKYEDSNGAQPVKTKNDFGRPVVEVQHEVHTDQQGERMRTKPINSVKLAVQEKLNTKEYIKIDQALSLQEALRVLLLLSVASLFGYWYVFPFLKSFIVLSSLVMLALYAFDPELAKQVARITVEAAKVLTWFLWTHPGAFGGTLVCLFGLPRLISWFQDRKSVKPRETTRFERLKIVKRRQSF
eukprot:snap_masked-scaffold_5-processed-gene-11.27-mRNA-1 protein AED:1.00 eAED:1.00 QI:0/0/0/0/1/1/2/0/739